jgi:hypothetical protein
MALYVGLDAARNLGKLRFPDEFSTGVVLVFVEGENRFIIKFIRLQPINNQLTGLEILWRS